MEVCTGGDVQAKIDDGKVLSVKEGIRLLKAVISGLAFMNKNKLMHRDIKPANIILDGEGNYKICDYGFAKIVGYDNKTFTTLGTPLYQAPEIWW